MPGIAHFFTFWGFVILGLTIVEAYGALVISQDFALPARSGARAGSGFLEDFFAVAVLLGIVYFAINRLRNAPEREQRASRFYGSHTGPAWVVLGMIALVVVTLLRLPRRAEEHRPLPVRPVEVGVRVLPGRQGAAARAPTTRASRRSSCSLQMAVIFGFPVLVDLLQAPAHRDCAAQRRRPSGSPTALGPLLPVTDADGAPIDFEDVENLSEDTVFGKGKIEDFTWKGKLDFATCTECGRCQSPVPGVEHRQAAVAQAA